MQNMSKQKSNTKALKKFGLKKSKLFPLSWLLLYSAFLVVIWFPVCIEIRKNIDGEYYFWQTFFYIFFGIIISLLWFQPTKDILHSLCQVINHAKKNVTFFKEGDYDNEKYQNLLKKKILIIQCLCNDFIEEASKIALWHVNGKNIDFVIVDDSNKPEQIEKIDLFCKNNNVTVVRRTGKERGKDHKSGNINNYVMKNLDKWDYLIVLDADERISKNIITEGLKYFCINDKIGIVQGCDRMRHTNNRFSENHSMNSKEDLLIFNINETLNNRISWTPYRGHNAIFSKECVVATNGFQKLISEDKTETMEAQKKGFACVMAPTILGSEDVPLNFFGYKKRLFRWVYGDVQFHKHYFFQYIFKKHWSCAEKLNLTSLCAFFTAPVLGFIFMITSLCATSFLPFKIEFPWYLVVVTIFFLSSPLMTMTSIYVGKTSIFKIIRTFLFYSIFYPCLTFTILVSCFCSTFNIKYKFVTTPKEQEKISIKNAFLYNLPEIILSLILIAIFIGGGIYSNWTNGFNIFFYLYALSGLLSPYFSIMSNMSVKKNYLWKNID